MIILCHCQIFLHYNFVTLTDYIGKMLETNVTYYAKTVTREMFLYHDLTREIRLFKWIQRFGQRLMDSAFTSG
jgi:hypothetical protein